MFTTVTPPFLQDWATDSTLIVDIRPHAAFSTARLPNALSLSVPSTLLKRPLFSLQRLSAMLPSQSARNRFSAWNSAARILVYDADSSAIPDSSNIYGLLRKFQNDGFKGDLAWLKGGFQAVWRERRDFIDTSPLTPDNENDDDDDDHDKAALRTRLLPTSAFSLASTTTLSGSPSRRQLPSRPNAIALTAPSQSFNPFFDTVRQNIELSHGITEKIPLRLPHRVRRRINDLPFPWLQQIARRADRLPHHHTSPFDSASSPSDDSDDDLPPRVDIDDGTDALASQFFEIEKTEQRRLMAIMEHHAKESGSLADHSTLGKPPFPFGITAGVEKGAKNRYRHIWPFEHARVRLSRKRENDDDYVNASFVQPLGTNKRYIATQGPLPATYTDFWTLCWEQNVHIIVMLTQEIEGSMVKCGTYWTDKEFGPLRLRLVSTSGQISPPEDPVSTGGFFPLSSHTHSHSHRMHSCSCSHHRFKRTHVSGHHTRSNTPSQNRHSAEIIKRVFELTHTGYPEAEPRKIVHFQYLDWPDMNVPDDARGVLGLVKEVEEAVAEMGGIVDDEKDGGFGGKVHAEEKARLSNMGVLDESTGVAQHALRKSGPVLLHCSAGVGRTGGFIAVDAVLDAIRREVRMKKVQALQVPTVDDNLRTVDVEMSSPLKSNAHTFNLQTLATSQDGQSIVPTLAIPMSGGEENHVHVPVVGALDGQRTPMQVDSISSQKDSANHTEVGQQSEVRASPSVKSQPLSVLSTPMTAYVSGSSSSEDSLFSVGLNNHRQQVDKSEKVDEEYPGRYYTSSFGTSVSGASSPFNHANFTTGSAKDKSISVNEKEPRALKMAFGANMVGRRPETHVTAPDAYFDGCASSNGMEGQRIRTFSAPTSRKDVANGMIHPLSSSLRTTSFIPWLGSSVPDKKVASPLPMPNGKAPSVAVSIPLQGRGRSSPYPGRPSSSLESKAKNGRATSVQERRVGRGLIASPIPQLGTRMRSKSHVRKSPSPSSRLCISSGGQSSDAEPPSRSQSPSADEGSVTNGGDSVDSSALQMRKLQEKEMKLLLHQQKQRQKPQPPAAQQIKPLSLSLPPPISFSFSTPSASLLSPTLLMARSHSVSDANLNVPHEYPPSILRDKDDANDKPFEFKDPRQLHMRGPPAVLNGYEDPIWEVILDMREQRMSLCQSLRQYVFVHAAILEGALMIVDEEEGRGSWNLMREKDKGEWPGYFGLGGSQSGKRGASPTELLKEGKEGQVLLSKRPSIKRKHRSGEGTDVGARPLPFQWPQGSGSGGVLKTPTISHVQR